MTTRKNLPGFGAACGALGAALAALLLAGCGPDNDPVDVEPMELTGREVPELKGTRPEDTVLDNEIDPMRNDDIDDPDRYLLAEAEIMAVGASGVEGEVRFEQRDDMMHINGRITGLATGDYGLHIHETGDCSGPGAISAGAHFSSASDLHGSRQEPDAQHHAGDLGNITADDNGNADFELLNTDLQLGSSSHSIVGRAIIVHADAYDLPTQPVDNAGTRIGCAVIKPVLQPAYVPE